MTMMTTTVTTSVRKSGSPEVRKSTTTFVIATLLALGCASSAQAAVEVCDLRVGLGGYGVSNASWNESYYAGSRSSLPSGSGSGTGWNGGGFGALSITFTQGHLPRHGGFIWGAGIESTSESHESTVLGVPNQRVTTSTFSFLGRLGYGVPFGSRVHMEFMPELHLGGLTTDVYDTDGSNLERTTASGGYAAIGMHAGWYAEVTRHLALGAELGVRRCAGSYSADFSSTGGRVEGNLYYTQWGGQAGIGVRF
jgi:hypothetical protein